MDYPRHPNYMGFHDTRPVYYSDSDSDSGWEPSNLYSSNLAHCGCFPPQLYGRSARLPRLLHENLQNNFNNINQYHGDGYSDGLDFPPRGRRTAGYDSYEAYETRSAAYRHGGPEYSLEPPLYGRRSAGFDGYNNFEPRRRDDRRSPVGAYSDGGLSDDLSGYGGDNDSIDDLFPPRDGTFYRPRGAQRGQGVRGFGDGAGMRGGVGMQGGYGGRAGGNAMAASLDRDNFWRDPGSGPGRFPSARFDPDAFPRRNPLEGASWGARGVLRPDEIEEA